jgi:hypothetical protein
MAFMGRRIAHGVKWLKKFRAQGSGFSDAAQLTEEPSSFAGHAFPPVPQASSTANLEIRFAGRTRGGSAAPRAFAARLH